MEVPKLSKTDMYKFMMYTLLKNNFTVFIRAGSNVFDL